MSLQLFKNYFKNLQRSAATKYPCFSVSIRLNNCEYSKDECSKSYIRKDSIF